MTETLKIIRACFIGGAICCAAALMVAPAFWWFGSIAGFCAGYLAYEFGEVLHAAPAAFRSVSAEASALWSELCHAGRKAKDWFGKPHPYIYAAWVLSFATALGTLNALYPFPNPDADNLVGASSFFLMCGFVSWIIFMFALVFTAEFGMGWDANYNEDQPANYANVYKWTGLGLVRVAVFFLWHFWGFLGIDLWRLVRLIHSRKRVLCAVDGTLGGAIALAGFYYYAPAHPSASAYMMTVFFGGFIGAALGAANWELVSKRVFGLGTPST